MSIDNRLLEIGELIEKVRREYDTIRIAIELNGSQFDESFDHLLCYYEIDKGNWKAINHMGEMEALKKRWKFLKELLGDFEGDISSWGYTNLDSVKKVIEITDYQVTNKSITDGFIVALTAWIDKELQTGDFLGVEWDGRG